MKKKNKTSLLDNRKFLAVFSFFLAVVFWIIIAGFVSPNEDNTIRSVEVNYQRDEHLYLTQGLVLMEEPEPSVEVSVRGNGSVVWTLGPSDVAVYPDYSTVNGPGVYTLRLKYEELSGGTYTIVDVEPKRVTLTFEAVEQETFTIVAEAPGIEAAEGFFKGTTVSAPATVDISGPSSAMEKLEEVKVVIHDEEVRQQSEQYMHVSLVLLDAMGNELDKDAYTMSISEVDVTVPILEVREIPLSVGISGQPPGFDEEWLQSLMQFSSAQIEVAGESSELDKITSLSVGTIDLSAFTLDADAYVFEIDLPKEIRNQEQVKQVVVTFDTSKLSERTFHVSADNIRVVNAVAGLDIDPENSPVNVTLIGPTDVLEALLPENIVIEVEAYGVTASAGGRQSISARVIVASSNRVFAPGSYEIVCDVQPA